MYYWSNNSKSNISNIDGLANFNPIIKEKIKYVYLNNNNFSNVNSLQGFNSIVQLNLMCNSNLSNIDGLSNHTSIDTLTLQSCALTNIGFYDSENNNYFGGLTGCSGLKKISVYNNSELTSLIGIESAIDLEYIIANDCNLNDINSLINHANVSYLDLSNNPNLINVINIKYCKGLRCIILDNNEDMEPIQVRDSLNSKVSESSSVALIANCVNGYQNIPKKFWDYFITSSSTIDFSYSSIGTYLTDDSIKWTALFERTNIRKLNLANQNKLSKKALDDTLKTLTGVEAITLENVANLDNIDFVSYMPNLKELDIRGTSSTLTNLSKLNSLSTFRTLIVNNYDIDFSLIQSTLNKFDAESMPEYDGNFNVSGTHNYCWGTSGLVLTGDGSKYNFSNCKSLTTFSMSKHHADVGASSGTIDLSGCTNLKNIISRYNGYGLKVPAGLQVIHRDACYANVDFSLLSVGLDTLSTTNMGTFGLSYMKNLTQPVKCINCYNCGDGNTFENFSNIIDVETVYLNFSSTLNCRVDFDGIEKFVNLKYLYITMPSSTNISNISNFSKIQNCVNLKEITISNVKSLSDITGIEKCSNLNYVCLVGCSINNISQLSSLKNLTALTLYRNVITNLSPLVSGITYSSASDTIGHINYTTLDISNNSLDGYSSGDNIIALLKLHQAGLQKVTITGNSFSSNEILELINGKTVDGVTYSGFGSGNVIN